jgi:hypothetical protein
MTEIIDVLPCNTFLHTQKRSWAEMEVAVLQLPETAHVVLEHAMHTKKKRRSLPDVQMECCPV